MPSPALIFDLDGTLVDTAPDLLSATNAVMASQGLPLIPPATLRHMVGFGARSLIEQKDYHPAVEMLREAIRFVPDNAEYRFALAQVELKNTMWVARGLENLKEAARLEPRRAQYVREAAVALHEHGRNEEAEPFARRAFDLEGSAENQQLLHAVLGSLPGGEADGLRARIAYAQSGNADPSAAEKILSTDKNNCDALAVRAADSIAHGQAANAVVAAQQITSQCPDRDGYYLLAQAYKIKGDAAGIRRAFLDGSRAEGRRSECHATS